MRRMKDSSKGTLAIVCLCTLPIIRASLFLYFISCTFSVSYFMASIGPLPYLPPFVFHHI